MIFDSNDNERFYCVGGWLHEILQLYENRYGTKETHKILNKKRKTTRKRTNIIMENDNAFSQ